MLPMGSNIIFVLRIILKVKYINTVIIIITIETSIIYFQLITHFTTIILSYFRGKLVEDVVNYYYTVFSYECVYVNVVS